MKKEKYLHIRMDEDTWRILEDAAVSDQQTDKPNISNYVRKLIRRENHRMTDELADAIHSLENQFIRIGNNINQIARSANMGLLTDGQKKHLFDRMDELNHLCEVLTAEIIARRL